MPTTTTSATTHPSEAGRLLAHLHQQGAAVSAEGGTLRVRAPRGAIDPDTAARIRQHKPALLALLRCEIPADAPAPDSQAIQEAIEERAAILEHDAGMARAQAPERRHFFAKPEMGSLRFQERKKGDGYCLRLPAFVLRPPRLRHSPSVRGSTGLPQMT